MRHYYRPLTLLVPLVLVSAVFAAGPQQLDLSKMLWEEIVKLSFEHPMAGSRLTVPNVLIIDVLSESKHREIIVRGGTTGSAGETSYVEIARPTKQTRGGPTGFDRFKVTLPNCEHLGNRLEVEVAGANARYKVHSRQFECQSESGPANTESK